MLHASFNTQLSKGHLGEAIVADVLEGKGCSIEWYTSLTTQRKGMDFKATKNGWEANIEVKYDIRSSETGNYFIEYYQPLYNKEGWLHTTQATYIAFVNKSVIHLVTPTKLRALIEQNKKTLRSVAEAGGESTGWLVRCTAIATIASKTLHYHR